MKKMVKSALALMTAFLATACMQENFNPDMDGSTVTFTVAVPEAVATKAAVVENGENINNLVYAVYRTEKDNQAEAIANLNPELFVYGVNPAEEKTTTVFADNKTTISLELINNQKYVVLFWAQVDQTWVEGKINENSLRSISYPANLVANDSKYAAFSGVAFVEEVKGSRKESVTLTRPFAQINLATNNPERYKVDVIASSVKIENAAATFNVATQQASEKTTVEYALATNPDGTFNGYDHYVAMNYIFANPKGENSETVTITCIMDTDKHGTGIEKIISNVPVAQNYKTNIVGNLLTSDVDYEVTLNEAWGDTDKVYEIWNGESLVEPATNEKGEYIVRMPSEWAWLANKQNPATKAAPAPIVINLASDLDFGGNKITGLVAPYDGLLTVNGNGYSILNAKVISGTTDNTTDMSSLFVSYSGSTINVSNLNVKNIDVLAIDSNTAYAAAIVGYVEGTVNISNVNVKSSTIHGTQSIGAILGFIPAYGTAKVENVLVDGVKLTNADVAEESGAMGGFVGRVAGKLTAAIVKVANTTIEAYVGTASDQKRSVAKFIGNFVGGGMINVTGASLENVTIVAKNELAETQQCLYTEFLGGWRGNGGTVSINGVEITKDQNNENLTVDTEAELAAAISNAADGAVIPVSGEIPTAALNASGKNITIVGMSDDATINSSSNRMHTNGNITFQNLTVTLPTNNDYFGGHDANGGSMVFDNCKFVGTATTINGNFTYKNCEFTNPEKYAAWVYGNSVVTYNNCTFSGPDRAAKVYSDGGSKVEVTYNNCTFKATEQANKTAVEIDCSRQTSGVPYYVTIINPTIENMGAAEHYAVGAEGVCNLETSGVGLGIVNLDGKGYSVAHTAAQLQALTNAGKDVTIQFAQDITGDFTYEQNNGEHVVIDGADKVFDGTITIKARGDEGNPNSLLIKNINFKTAADSETFIHSVETNYYPNNVTVSNCTFEGTGAESSVLPVDIKSASKFVMENCTATKVHSLIQNTSGWNITIRNCEVTESGRGIALGTVQGATIENVKIDALDTKYGIRMDAGYNNNATIKDCEISAFIPVVVRKASVNSTVVFNGTNTMTPANTDGLWCVIGTSEYEANGVMPTAPTAQVTVTLNDSGLNPAGVYGAANL